VSANADEASFRWAANLQRPTVEGEKAIQHPFDLTNMRFALAVVGKRDIVKRGCDVFVQHQTLDDSNEVGDITRKLLQQGGVFPCGGHRTGS
jgi:hypothetical protein